MTDPKYPEVEVTLIGDDGNAFQILARCMTAARRAKVPAEKIKAFEQEATSGDYDHLLSTCVKWFTIN